MFAKRPLSETSRLLVLAAAAVALIVLLVSDAGAASTQKTCPEPHGNGRQARFVRVTGVSCNTARTLIRKVVAKTPSGCLEAIDDERARLRASCRIGGYRCTARGVSDDRIIDGTCKRGAKRVRFQY